MLEIVCYDSDGRVIDHLTQWDVGQSVSVRGATYSGEPVFHFCNRRSYEALVVPSKNVDGALVANIPNVLLAESLPIEIYMYYQQKPGAAKTVYTISIPVEPRKKPADYIFEDNLDYVGLVEINKQMSAALAEVRKAVDEVKEAVALVDGVVESARTAANEASAAATSANDAAKKATDSSTSATQAAQSAQIATQSANEAAQSAKQEANKATNASESANNAAAEASSAAQEAVNAGNSASAAAQAAIDASKKADAATQNAETAITSATAAAQAAESSSKKADEAAARVDSAVNTAEEAAEHATTAADGANSAANVANNAARVATEAANEATSAASKADTASASATEAASAAKTASERANTAAASADAAKNAADESTRNANLAAENANEAATKANEAAQNATIGLEEVKKDVGNKLDKPTAQPAAGQILKVRSTNPDGSFVVEWADDGGGAVSDVRINGNTIVQDGVADIPIAGENRNGVVNNGVGIQINNYGSMYTMPASNGLIIDRIPEDGYSVTTNNRFIIAPSKLDFAVKSAMCDGKGPAWTVEEQSMARERMGIDKWEPILETELAEQALSVEVKQFPDSSPLSLSKFCIFVTNIPENTPTNASKIRFDAGTKDVVNLFLRYVEIPLGNNRYATTFYQKLGDSAYLIVSGKGNKSNTSYNMDAGVSRYDYGGSDATATIINRLAVRTNNKDKFQLPAGTKITVYGVRI